MKREFNANGLEYVYDEYSDAYQVVGCGNCEEEVLQISQSYNEKPVLGIGDFAFQNCKKITGVAFGEQLRFIGESAFNFCENLEKIRTPFALTNIEKYTFYGCKNLQRVELGENLRQINENAFGDCVSLTEVLFPSSLLRIGRRAFYNCTRLTKIHMPPSLKIIEEGAFYNCENLTQVTFNSELTSIGKFAFGDCVNIQTLVFNGTIQQWRAVQKGEGWHRGIPAKKIICQDGEEKL